MRKVKNYSAAFLGTLTGPPSGELNCNLTVRKFLEDSGGCFKNTYFIDTNLESQGIKYAGAFSFTKFFRMLSIYQKLFSVLNKVDIVYMTPGLSKLGFFRFIISLLLCKLFNKKVVFHYHGSRLVHDYYNSGCLYKGFVKYALKYVDCNVFLTSSLMNKYVDIGCRNSCKVVFNFYDAQLFDYISKKDKPVDSVIKVLYLSNLIEEKGYKVAIDICQKAHELGLSIELNIAGGGDENAVSYIHSKVNSLSFPVNYLGCLVGEDKYKQYLNADYLVFPTTYKQEGLPLVILEAMISRVLVITTSIGGIPDLIEHKKTGMFLEKDNFIESGAHFIDYYHRNKPDKKQIVSKAAIKAQKFDEQLFCQSIYQILVSLVENENITD